MASEASRSAHWWASVNTVLLDVMNLAELQVDRGHISQSVSTRHSYTNHGDGEMRPGISKGDVN